LHWLQRTGFDLLGDIVVGILGVLIATWLFPVLDIALAIGGGVLGTTILAFIGAVISPPRTRQPGRLHQTASFAALTGRTLRIFLAGFALNTVGSLVNGLMPVRSLVAGFLTTMNLAKPGSRNSPLFFISL